MYKRQDESSEERTGYVFVFPKALYEKIAEDAFGDNGLFEMNPETGTQELKYAYTENNLLMNFVQKDKKEQGTEEEEAFKGKCTRDEVELPDAECKGAIVWKNVHFSYSADREVLKGISFQIKKGQMVAFAGGSGEGKSTIARLLYGLYRKESGSYQLFGKDVEQWSLREWRDCFSVVSQNVFLLPQSVAENVACGKEGAAREEIEEACRAADIHDFIMRLPQGYDTQVGLSLIHI